MDGKKIEAMNYRYKRPNYYFLDFYSISTALACTLFCCLTLTTLSLLPYLSSMVSSVYMSSSLLIPVLLSSKLLFIISNLIIIVVLMRNSKILINSSSEYYYSSSNSHVYYDEYIQSSTTHLVPDPTNLEVIKKDKTFGEEGSMDMIMKPWGGGGGGGVLMKSTKKTTTQKWTEDKGDGQSSNLVASSDELNKRAEDFIARVNRHRRLELSLLQYGSSY